MYALRMSDVNKEATYLLISYSFDGYRGLGLHPFFYNFALLFMMNK